MNERRKWWLILGGIGLLLALGAGVCLLVVLRRFPATQSRSGLDSSGSREADKAVGLGALRRQGELFIGASENNVPIHFWGKVVDQDGAALPNVAINARVRSWDVGGALGIQGRFSTKSATTDTAGRFEISGVNGDVVTIESMQRTGFDAEPNSLRSFQYNKSTNAPSASDRPVLFRMWKHGGRQSIVSGDKPVHLVPDGRIYTVDLVRGVMSESSDGPADLRVQIERPSSVSFGQKYDWSCTIDAVGGGLCAEADRYSSMFLAPEDGYLSRVEFKRSATDRPWEDGMAGRRFYLKSRGGQVFGRLEMDIYAYYNTQIPARIGIGYALNTNGSRILR